MDIKNPFRLAKKVEVVVEDPNTGHRHVYTSRVEDIGQNTLTIAAPYRRGAFLPPWPGRQLNCRIAADNCAYAFTATLLRSVLDPIPLWIISAPADLKKIQLRAYVRLDIVLDVKLELVAEEDGPALATLTRDISAGGLRIVVPKPLLVGTKVKVSLPLPAGTTVEAVGEVIRAIPSDNPNEKHNAAIEFTDIKEKARGEIVKFIFRKEVERRKKELERGG